jgi:hypothetical protein
MGTLHVVSQFGASLDCFFTFFFFFYFAEALLLLEAMCCCSGGTALRVALFHDSFR